MSIPTYFVQECPTCGRLVQVRLAYLGRQVKCQHCCGEFTARDPSNKSSADDSTIIERADALLELLSARSRSRLQKTQA